MGTRAIRPTVHPVGDGGDVTVTVAQRDQGLLMLVKGNLVNGGIGFAGETGRGGKRRGRGGKGGSSYHWTETKRYTDSQGRSQSRTVFRSNPGGSNGRPGRNGASSSYRAHDGIPGIVGEFSIVVVDENGAQQKYGSPYNLELITFDVASEYGVLEPDSLVSVDHIVIQNTGGMPTPANYTVRVFLDSERWLLNDQVDLVLHRSLHPGETHVFDAQGLRCRLGDHEVNHPRKRSFRLRQAVSPQARLESGIARPFRQFENRQEIQIRFSRRTDAGNLPQQPCTRRVDASHLGR